jgi:ribosome maturation factor RimP
MKDVSLLAGNAAREIIENLGFEMADVEYVREDGQMCLNFYIRSKNGVNIDDCETVSRAIDEAVENADPTGGKPYCLCVSTWGDRALKNDNDLDFFLNVLVEVKVKKALSGKKKKFTGELIAYDEFTVTVGDTVFEKENIEIIRPYIGF